MLEGFADSAASHSTSFPASNLCVMLHISSAEGRVLLRVRRANLVICLMYDIIWFARQRLEFQKRKRIGSRASVLSKRKRRGMAFPRPNRISALA